MLSNFARGTDVRLVAAARMLVRAATAEAQRRLSERGLGELRPLDTLILGQLAAHGDSRATQIAQRLAFSKQAIQRPLKRLAANGYTETVTDPSDRRAQLIRLTAAGRRAATAVLEVASEIDGGWEQMAERAQLDACRALLMSLVRELRARQSVERSG